MLTHAGLTNARFDSLWDFLGRADGVDDDFEISLARLGTSATIGPDARPNNGASLASARELVVRGS